MAHPSHLHDVPDHQTGFDSLLQRLYSPNFPLVRVSELASSDRGRTLFPVALFSHPGYTNMLFADLNSDGTCLVNMCGLIMNPSCTAAVVI